MALCPSPPRLRLCRRLQPRENRRRRRQDEAGGGEAAVAPGVGEDAEIALVRRHAYLVENLRRGAGNDGSDGDGEVDDRFAQSGADGGHPLRIGLAEGPGRLRVDILVAAEDGADPGLDRLAEREL